MNYIVIESQTNAEGATVTVLENGTIPTYSTLEAALNKFFTICAYAAIAHLYEHAVTILTEDHRIVKHEVFNYTEPQNEEQE